MRAIIVIIILLLVAGGIALLFKPATMPMNETSTTATVITPAVEEPAPTASVEMPPADTPPATTPVTEAALTPQGLGDIMIGMTLAEASAAAGKELALDPSFPADGCNVVSLNDGVYMIFENGLLMRISVNKSANYRTPEGIMIGSTEDQVKAAYGDALIVEPHKYVDGHYLKTNQNESGYMFETNGSTVTAMHAGRYPTVAYIEACS